MTTGASIFPVCPADLHDIPRWEDRGHIIYAKIRAVLNGFQ
jgi:hypothetical protein